MQDRAHDPRNSAITTGKAVLFLIGFILYALFSIFGEAILTAFGL